MKPKSPPIPAEKDESIRQKIRIMLAEGKVSAKEISMAVGIREKDVFGHLEHIQQSCRRGKEQLAIIPPVCKGCGFVFKKRTRLTKPGKCPICRGSTIEEPLYYLA